MTAWHRAREKGIGMEAEQEAVVGSREISGRERKAGLLNIRGHWWCASSHVLVPSHTALSAILAGSLWDSPRWQVDKGQWFLCTGAGSKPVCLAQKLSRSYWHVTKSLTLPRLRRRDGRMERPWWHTSISTYGLHERFNWLRLSVSQQGIRQHRLCF